MNTMSDSETFRVLVLAGGPSSEREISLQTGAAVADALQQAGHTVRVADISPADTTALDADDINVVFIALHGQFGESGEVQQICQARGLRYVGSGPTASRLGLDKAASKQYFRRAGLDTPDWMIIERWHDPRKVATWLAEIPLPVVVKPVDSGSSVDVHICRTESQRADALDDLTDIYDRALLEAFVPGREFSVGILDNQPLPVVEIRPTREFYDYTAKYADNAGTEYVFDHDLDAAAAGAMQAAAAKAHACLGCRDLSRVDFILPPSGPAQVLEINTIPGFTSHSLVPMAARRTGLEMPKLCDRLVRLAAAREVCVG